MPLREANQLGYESGDETLFTLWFDDCDPHPTRHAENKPMTCVATGQARSSEPCNESLCHNPPLGGGTLKAVHFRCGGVRAPRDISCYRTGAKRTTTALQRN